MPGLALDPNKVGGSSWFSQPLPAQVPSPIPQPMTVPGGVTDLPPLHGGATYPSGHPEQQFPSGTSTQWGGPALNAQSPVPQTATGSGTSTAWGGGPVNPPVAAPTSTLRNQENAKKYSFMDNPGATDALVAFGAAMLKAPDFNTGLGDASLAVNQVAKQYRPLTDQDFERAKQLGMLRRLESGQSSRFSSKEMGYAPLGSNGEMVPVPAFLDPQGGVLYQYPDGSMKPTPPTNWTRAEDSFSGSLNRYSGKEQAEIQAKAAADVDAASESLASYDTMLGVLDTAGVGSDLRTMIGAEITKYTGKSFDGVDPTDQARFGQKFNELQIQFSSKLQGQGQITEFERKIIAAALPNAAMNKEAARQVLMTLKRGAQRKIDMWNRWNSDPALRAQYNDRWEVFKSQELQRISKEQEAAAKQTPNTTATPTPPTSGSQSNPALEEALKKYGG